MRLMLVAVLAVATATTGCPRAVRGARASPPSGEVWLSAAQAEASHVETEAVLARDVEATLDASGRVAWNDTLVEHVASPLSGRVARIDVALGARVKTGDALAVIASPDLGATSADLRKAHADREQAERAFVRENTLLPFKATSQADWEQAKGAFDRAKAEESRCIEKITLLGVQPTSGVTQHYVLRSGMNGEVLARSVSLGLEVQGAYGGGAAAELFTVGDVSEVWVLADVFEMDLGRVALDAKARVEVPAYPGTAFDGRVSWISPTLDPQTRTAKVRCVIDNQDKLLKPEMYATVGIAVRPKRALTVPATAVLRLGDQRVVFVRRGETGDGRVRYERTPVMVDEPDKSGVLPVMYGLAVGDQVVTSGAALLSGML
jgi:cobalt-zinc-cadmium efflux system membrane fusion protein